MNSVERRAIDALGLNMTRDPDSVAHEAAAESACPALLSSSQDATRGTDAPVLSLGQGDYRREWPASPVVPANIRAAWNGTLMDRAAVEARVRPLYRAMSCYLPPTPAVRDYAVEVNKGTEFVATECPDGDIQFTRMEGRVLPGIEGVKVEDVAAKQREWTASQGRLNVDFDARIRDLLATVAELRFEVRGLKARLSCLEDAGKPDADEIGGA